MFMNNEKLGGTTLGRTVMRDIDLDMLAFRSREKLSVYDR